MKYRKRPVVVEAVQITQEWFDWKECPPDEIPVGIQLLPMLKEVQIRTLEGVMVGNVGDWIITGVNGELYPCKPDIFAKTYEKVELNPVQPPLPGFEEAVRG